VATFLALIIVFSFRSLSYGEQAYSWWGNGPYIDYGVPETSDRAIRISCKDGSFSVSGPGVGLKDGDNVILRIGNSTFAQKITVYDSSQAAEPGWKVDGISRRVIENLIKGKNLRIQLKSFSSSELIADFRVPGVKSAEFLGPLMASCKKKSKLKNLNP
jgi:hypothetical protein